MVSKAIVTTLTGVGAFISSDFLPTGNARALAKLSGAGIGAVGLGLLVDEIKEAGGLGAFTGGLIGGTEGVVTERAVKTVSNPVLADPETTAATPHAPGKLFVIPYVGKFVDPKSGGIAKRGLLSSTWKGIVRLSNFSPNPVTSPFTVNTSERRLVGATTQSTFTSDTFTLAPGEEREFNFHMALGGDSLSVFHPVLQPKITATLVWPDAPPLLPRPQQTITFQVLS